MTQTSNPLLKEWNTPFGLPPFRDISVEHYEEAFEAGISQQTQQIDAIVSNQEAPTFTNTIEAIESSGAILKRVAPVFYAILSSDSTQALRAAQTRIVPIHSQHQSMLFARKDLFKKVDAVFHGSTDHLGTEEQQLLSETHKRMMRQGAALDTSTADRIVDIDTQLASLQTKFGQNVLADTNEFELLLSKAEVKGLPESVCRAAEKEASDRGETGKYLFSISRSSFTPFMQFAERRDLREKMWHAYTHCANNSNEFDNKEIAEQVASLRAQRANLMSYNNHSDYVLSDRMAGTADNVKQLLDQIWAPAKQKALSEVDTLQARIQQDGGNFELAPWDWWFYSEKVRQATFDIDGEALKQYFELTRVRDGAFQVAKALYGITFSPVDVELYHKDAQAFEVKEANGDFIGLFITDYHLRPSKKAGAWMNAFRSQKRHEGISHPIILNTCNFPSGSPCLLTLEEVRTLFHEFGHGLHGLLSGVHYQSLSGTNVKRDFVELPSQIMEHWGFEPDVLNQYARHYSTNEAIPGHMIEKITASQAYNSGFATVEYLAASYLDLHWHDIGADISPNAEKLEQDAMQAIALLPEIAPRYRSSYFQHIFSGGYSAGYYAYIWAEVLDADAFEEFKQNGLFDAKTAGAFRENILSKGGTQDPMVLYKNFKGRSPAVEPLMRNRGLS